LYCGKFPKGGEGFPTKLKEQMENAMEHVRKDHYLAFYKHLFVCNLALGLGFLKEI
jgi:hypothetical protein